MDMIAESVLTEIETKNLDGITSADLLAFFAEQRIRFGEATLRKWVQLGLLPRSVRVGRKGKHQGSKGKYPVRVVRTILRIKELMAQDLTIEEIQKQFLFVRGDIEALEQALDEIFRLLGNMVDDRGDKNAAARAAAADLGRARSMATELVDRLERIERRLMVAPGGERSEEVAS
ncbi:MAG: hypothetical protein JRI68_17560 [Deltaproteobacteria bacterium]|nr:hypothetical protein [Deltaproteobacteria bacterium]